MKTACRPGIFTTDTPKPGESALVAHLTTHSSKSTTALRAQRHINTHHMAVSELPLRVLPLWLHALPINHSQAPAITPLKLVFGSALSLVGCQVLGNRHFLGERQHTQCLLTPEREPATGENNDYTDVHFVEPLTFFIGVAHKSGSKGLLTKGRDNSKAAVLPAKHLNKDGNPQRRHPGALSGTCTLLRSPSR